MTEPTTPTEQVAMAKVLLKKASWGVSDQNLKGDIEQLSLLLNSIINRCATIA